MVIIQFFNMPPNMPPVKISYPYQLALHQRYALPTPSYILTNSSTPPIVR